MQNINLNFDEGLKSFTINGDESRVVWFNPADPDLLPRYYKALEIIKTAADDIPDGIRLDSAGNLSGENAGLEEAAKALVTVNGVIREALSLMFNTDVYDVVFAGKSPFCLVSGGRFLFEAFMEALQPVLRKETEAYAEASGKRVDKYLKGYRK